MAFQTPITIAKTLNHIRQNDYVLPAIQREFEWQPRQITTLFDSLMRGYPIGTFLFWRIDADRCGDFKFYQFLSDYHERDRRHNSPIDVTGAGGVTAILDGQQRLTSLNIGLRGSYAWKIKYGRWNSDHAFPQRRLYLNLLRPAEVRTGVELKYDFRFLTKNRAANSRDGEHWFLVKEVFDWRSLRNVMSFLRQHSLWDSEYAEDCLSKLLTVIHTEKLVSSYQEDEQDIDKVLNPDYSWIRLIKVSDPTFSCGRSPVSLKSLSIRRNRLKNRTIGPVSNPPAAISAAPRRQLDCPVIKSHRFGPFPGLDFPAGPYPGAQDTRFRRRHNRCQSVAA